MTSTRDSDSDSSSTPEDEWKVESICGEEFKRNEETGKKELHYKVHWVGFPSTDDTWEPLANLKNSKELLREWRKSRERREYLQAHPLEAKERHLSDASDSKESTPSEEWKVESIRAEKFRLNDETGVKEIHFKVHWTGFTESEDTWEPRENLANAQHVLHEWETSARRRQYLDEHPLPPEAIEVKSARKRRSSSVYSSSDNEEATFEQRRAALYAKAKRDREAFRRGK